MKEEKKESPDLLWTCFVNWINTIENVITLDSEKTKTFDEHLGIK